MKRKFISILILAVLAVAAFSACSKKEEKKTVKKLYYSKDYSISFLIKGSDDFADSLITNNLDSLFYSINVTQSGKKKKYFEVKIDSIANYDAAWMQGFHFANLFKIKNFNIYKNGRKVADRYREFYFVGKYLDRAALYSLDLFTLKTNLVWSRWGKPILKLFRQEKTGNIYFTVAQKLSRSGGFASIRRAQLYLFNAGSLTVKRIAYYGNGMQLKAGWISPNLFNAQFLLLDSLTNANIIKQSYDYDASGNLLDTLVEKIDLTSLTVKEEKPKLEFESESKKFSIKFREAEDSVIASVVDFREGLKVDIFKFKGKILSTLWSDNENYFLMNSVDSLFFEVDSTMKSVKNLFVVNLRNHKLLTTISGDLDEYMLRGDILIYDQWIEGEKTISVYDLMKQKEIIALRFEGGCGINSILNLNNL